MTNIIKYPEDLTGLAPTNLVQGEEILLPRINNRGFSPKAGPFYADSLKVWHKATGKLLKPGVDYQILVMHSKATKESGKLVCSLVYVSNPEYSEGFIYDYQVVGGDRFSTNYEAIQLMIDQLQLDGRSIIWDNILDKPVLFPPAPHLHDVADWFGMEQVVDAINALTQAILSGDVALKEQILTQLRTQQQVILTLQSSFTQLSLRMGQVEDRVTAIGG